MNIESIKEIKKVVNNKNFDGIRQTIETSNKFHVVDQINEMNITDRDGNFIDKDINWGDLCKSTYKLFQILDSKNQSIKVKSFNENDDKLVIGTIAAFATLLHQSKFKSFQECIEDIGQYKLNYYKFNNINILVLPQILDWSTGGLLFPDNKLYSISLKDNTLFYISKDENEDKYNVILACTSVNIYELEEDYD